MTDVLTEEQLAPTNPLISESTVKVFERRFDAGAVQEFLDKTASPSTPPAIGATASVDIAIWGKARCSPDSQPWLYDNTIWGGPAYFGTSTGFMYTAYDSWDAFFKNVTSCHCQGIAEGGGILQINWFNASAVPVGQYNGVAGGIGLLEAGGSGGWVHK